MSSAPPDEQGGCLSDATLAMLAGGDIPPVERAVALQHLDECPSCQALAALVVRGLHSEGSEVDGVPLAINFRAGSLIGGRYRIERFIARGGMGEVYDAYDIELRERVALKTGRSTTSDSVRAQDRLRAEVQLARRISHPNVCRIYDLGRHDVGEGQYLNFASMEFIDGETLGQQLRRSGVALELAESIAHQLLMGLNAAHGAGVLHRDFKSDNIMLRTVPGGEVRAVITDFGLARALDPAGLRQSDSQRVVGSVAYMAPEQVLGGKLGPAADVYAFGVVFYEVLTRRLPFTAESPMAVALMRLQKKPEPPSKVANVPPVWDEFVLRCLSRDITRRFPTVDVALVEFRRVLAQRQKRAARRAAPYAMAGLVAVAGLLVLHLLGGARQVGGVTPSRTAVVEPRVSRAPVAREQTLPLPLAAGTAATAPVSEPAASPPAERTVAEARPSRAVSRAPVREPKAAGRKRHPSATALPSASSSPPAAARHEPLAPSAAGVVAPDEPAFAEPPATRAEPPATRAEPPAPVEELTLDRGNPWEKP